MRLLFSSPAVYISHVEQCGRCCSRCCRCRVEQVWLLYVYTCELSNQRRTRIDCEKKKQNWAYQSIQPLLNQISRTSVELKKYKSFIIPKLLVGKSHRIFVMRAFACIQMSVLINQRRRPNSKIFRTTDGCIRFF